MTIGNAVALAGGLGMFLFGMRVMSQAMEDAAGPRLRRLLETVTRSRIRAVLTGMAVTAAIQSSSAATVMTIGFVHAGLLALQQAAGVIMGANIGTTVTALMLSADVDFAALFAAGGLLLSFLPRRAGAARTAGTILTGLGVLFTGMDMMSAAVHPLREYPPFLAAMARASHPAAGLLIGVIVTAVLQSSSAGVGILQALAGEDLVSLESALFILYGQNIGTCITALLACRGASCAARRTAALHLLFNLAGAALMTALTLLFPLADWMRALSPHSTRLQIALSHVLFNVATTLALLPLTQQLERAACAIVPPRS